MCDSILRRLRIFAAIALLTSVFMVVSCSKDNDPPVKDEGLYINEIYASGGEDWIELYNSTDASVDLGGYKIYDDPSGKYSLPSGTSIPSKGFLIIICDDSGTGLSTNFKLSSSGETVYLENKAGNVIDEVIFPPMEDGQSYGRYPDGTSTWKISGNTTRGSSNGETTAPIISSVERTPLVPALDQSVTVKTEILNTSNISSVTLYYRFNSGSYNTVAMTQNSTIFSASIPAMNAPGRVDYYVEAKNNAELISKFPFDAPDDVYAYLLNNDALPQLKINEFLAANTSCCPDTDGGTQEFNDWIEIYNMGANPVDIADFYLSDNLSNPFNSRIKNTNPSKTTIPAGGFIVVWADNDRAQGELHLDFALSASGEAVGLYYKDGRVIDSYTFGAQTENVSMGRETDGGATWKSFSTPTPGQSNQ